jgi:hypothetical protein
MEAKESRSFKRRVLKQWGKLRKDEEGGAGEDQAGSVLSRLVERLASSEKAARTVRKQLFHWTFLATGRHACLGFLELHVDTDKSEPRRARRRTAFFCTMGPPLLDWWQQELNTRSRPAKALRTLPQADRLWECVLAAARRDDGGPTAALLLRCLKLSALHESAPSRSSTECHDLLQHHNPSIVAGYVFVFVVVLSFCRFRFRSFC